MSKVILSVDWDFFFPIPEHDPTCLYDWGHSEHNALFFGAIWTVRASDFLSRGLDFPISSGEEKEFWSRFTFKKHAALYYAESHAYMLHQLVSRGATKVLNYDAHHDSGYSKWFRDNPEQTSGFPKETELCCDNWAAHFITRGIRVETIYPAWKFYALKEEQHPQVELPRRVDDGKDVSIPIDRVFLCRSGAWVPPWMDDEFDEFMDACPVKRKIQVGDLFERTWKPSDAEEMAEKLKTVMAQSWPGNVEVITEGHGAVAVKGIVNEERFNRFKSQLEREMTE